MGFIKAACDFTYLWKSDSMPGWNAEWTTGAVQSVDAINSGLEGNVEGRGGAGWGAGGRGGEAGGGDGGVVCDEWVDHPVLVVQRDTFANFFHDRFVSLYFVVL